MPFIMVDDFDTSGNGSDELFADVTPDQLAKIILTGVAEHIGTLVKAALRPYIYAKTGNIDYMPEEFLKPLQPRK